MIEQSTKRSRTVSIDTELTYYYYRCSKCKRSWDSTFEEEQFCSLCSIPMVMKAITIPTTRQVSVVSYSKLIFERDNHICQNCSSKFFLQVHHIDYDYTNWSEGNVITLCSSCNTKANFNKVYWVPYYRDKVKTKLSIMEKVKELLG